MVLLIKGVIVGSAGPLEPLAMERCLQQARLQESDWDRAFAGSPSLDIPGEGVVYRIDFKADCVMLDTRPTLQNPVTLP
jgi:hypothetical protein